MTFLTGLLSRIGSWVVPFFLEFLYGKIKRLIEEWKAKKKDDKETQEIVDKINTGDLKKGLEGAAELEDKINRNT